MAIYIGTGKSKELFLGAGKAKEIYLGTDRVYSSSIVILGFNPYVNLLGEQLLHYVSVEVNDEKMILTGTNYGVTVSTISGEEYDVTNYSKLLVTCKVNSSGGGNRYVGLTTKSTSDMAVSDFKVSGIPTLELTTLEIDVSGLSGKYRFATYQPVVSQGERSMTITGIVLA